LLVADSGGNRERKERRGHRERTLTETARTFLYGHRVVVAQLRCVARESNAKARKKTHHAEQ